MQRDAVCACIVLGPATVGAQPVLAPADSPAQVTASNRTQACVDLTDAALRRIVEIEPCKVPLVAPPVGPAPRWPAYPARSSNGAHPMFWRFPVQPVGPFDAPRHVRR